MSIRSDFILSLDINVIIVISIILITKNGIYSESVYNNERFNDSQLITQCIARCPNQNKTNGELLDPVCDKNCNLIQCTTGCNVWENALNSTCENVCDHQHPNVMNSEKLYCVMGCNDAQKSYFEWLKSEVNEFPAPALVADTLTATGLSLDWQIPSKLKNLTKGLPHLAYNYFVQWRYEMGGGDWKYCCNQTLGNGATIKLDFLQPYTKYRFRIVLLLSPHQDEVLVSDESVIISTLAQGKPGSSPKIVRAVPIDHTRILISWEPGPFSNGALLSYVIQIRNINSNDFTALKDVSASTSDKLINNILENLKPYEEYEVSIRMRNAEGEGPASTTTVKMPKKREINEQKPSLILGARSAIYNQKSLSDVSTTLYSNQDQSISGVAIHIGKQLLFVSDENKYVIKLHIDSPEKREKIIGPESHLNFKPLSLSMDWLNDELYILGELKTEHSSSWQIMKCDLNGGGLSIVITGLQGEEVLHFEVDPYNGFLFWLIQDTPNDCSLYKLDLADDKNQTTVPTPILLYRQTNLGAFTVDFTGLRILIPLQNNDTVISLGLDGKRLENIRNNTQKSAFSKVKSLAYAGQIFYWTNGTDLFTEEYHREKDIYYHNQYSDWPDTIFISVIVNNKDSQPIPIALSPPTNLQVILNSNKAIISWVPPDHLAVQSKAAWQNWKYMLEVTDSKNNSKTFKDISGTNFTIEKLPSNSVYKFTVVACTTAGCGTKSLQFIGKTLPTGHEIHMIWSTRNGLIQSNVLGLHVHTLIPNRLLNGETITDITWLDDKLYFISNSSIKFYNRTTGIMGQFNHWQTIKCISIDWIGKKLYWYDENHQVIKRSDLTGENEESLFARKALRIQIDALNGYIYYSTSSTVEAMRLSGNEIGSSVSYFNSQLHWKQSVVSLTINYETEELFWIVRSNEASILYKGPLAHRIDSNLRTFTNYSLNCEPHPIGPIHYLPNRLVWLQNENSVVISDIQGNYMANIRNLKLKDITTFTVINDKQYKYPMIQGPIRVTPSSIDANTITIVGSWDSFNITWPPVTNVNYGTVFYELTIQKSFTTIVTVPYYTYDREKLEPFTDLHITIQPFTYWSKAKPTQVIRNTPATKPSAPSNPRAFIHYVYQPFGRDTSKRIDATFRWDQPEKPNGLILGYKIYGGLIQRNGTKKYTFEFNYGKYEELVLSDIFEKSIYFFEVEAFTNAGIGPRTSHIEIDTSKEITVPRILVARGTDLIEVDFDTETTKPHIIANSAIKFVSQFKLEDRLFWITITDELFMSHNGMVTKLCSMENRVLSFTSDWIDRTLYWSEITDSGSVLKSLNLERYKANDTNAVTILAQGTELIQSIAVFPMSRMLFWVELNKLESKMGELFYYNLNSGDSQMFFPTVKQCNDRTSTKIYKVIAQDFRNSTSPRIIWADRALQIYSTDIMNGDCDAYGLHYDERMQTPIKDSSHFYWIRDNAVFAKNLYDTNEFSFNITNAKTILASYNQEYPNSECLIPQRNQEIDYSVMLVLKSENIIRLEMPELGPDTHGNKTKCLPKIPGVKYTLLYREMVGDEDVPDSIDGSYSTLISFDLHCDISQLKPFTKYLVQLEITNYYAELSGVAPIRGGVHIYETDYGTPSPPQNVSANVISPTEAVIRWKAPNTFNGLEVQYVIHWIENPIDGVVTQHNMKTDYISRIENADDELKTTLRNLHPNQFYEICVKAISMNNKSMSSEKIAVRTFNEPENITVNRISSTEISLQWQPPTSNISMYRVYYQQMNKNAQLILVYDSSESGIENTNHTFNITNLLPKTMYKVFVEIFFLERSEPFLWPKDSRFLYETIADVPSIPGRPQFKQLSNNIYQVYWEPSRNNGEELELYCLEMMKLKRLSKRNKRFAVINKNITTKEIATTPVPQVQLAWAEDSGPVPEIWEVVYNGTDTHWILKFAPEYPVIFRVKAFNTIGWSNYSERSEEFSSSYYVSSQSKFTLISVVCIVALIVIFIGYYLIHVLTCQTKKIDDKDGNELNSLRYIPNGPNFIHRNNLIYSPGPLMDSDLALLPQIHFGQLKTTGFLGSGAFGEVYAGCVMGSGDEPDLRVAIKKLRKGSSDQKKEEFLQEAQLMSNFKHKHILSLIGICFDSDSLSIIMELMEGGDLLSFLRSNRPTEIQPSELTFYDLVCMCVDIASGCRYLEEMHFVHRDLACRNCLISNTDSNRIVKIGDFGLARDIYKNDYYRKDGGAMLPVRWMPPESLVDGVFTTQSDIWAFGVTCWEIMSLGQYPYPGRDNMEVMSFVRNGGTLERPVNCPDIIYDLMLKCWSYQPDNRPTFRCCLEELKQYKETISEINYLTSAGLTKIPNDGILNVSYLLAGRDHNHNKVIVQCHTSELQLPPINTPTSSTASTIMPYLELKNSSVENLAPGDGYEIPRSPKDIEGDFNESDIRSCCSFDEKLPLKLASPIGLIYSNMPYGHDIEKPLLSQCRELPLKNRSNPNSSIVLNECHTCM